jgi:hypothetical protein
MKRVFKGFLFAKGRRDNISGEIRRGILGSPKAGGKSAEIHLAQGSRFKDQLPPNRSVLHVPEAPSFAAPSSIPAKVLLDGPGSDADQLPEYEPPRSTRALHVPVHPAPVLRADQVP